MILDRGTVHNCFNLSNSDCNFSLPQVTLTGSDIFQVKAGDHYGFTWLNYGVIDFDNGVPQNFCENPNIFNVGQQANLVVNRYGGRHYSLRLMYSECEEERPQAECGECHGIQC